MMDNKPEPYTAYQKRQAIIAIAIKKKVDIIEASKILMIGLINSQQEIIKVINTLPSQPEKKGK